jgi:protein involved in polysaccharide export with SLBB domain
MVSALVLHRPHAKSAAGPSSRAADGVLLVLFPSSTLPRAAHQRNAGATAGAGATGARTRVPVGGQVFYTPNLDTDQQVRPDGKISLPLIGDIEVAGRTPEALRGQLLERYAGKLVDPEINVIVRTWPNRRILVSGQVLKPGVYEMTPSMTVLEAVMFAGGPDFREGDVSEVVVIRGKAKTLTGISSTSNRRSRAQRRRRSSSARSTWSSYRALGSPRSTSGSSNTSRTWCRSSSSSGVTRSAMA